MLPASLIPLGKRFLGLVALVLLSGFVHAAPLRVVLLLAEEGGAYREFATSLESELKRQNISLAISQANTLPTDADLIVAVGIKSAAIAINSRTPVLCTLVSKSGFDKLLHEWAGRREKNTISAIYMDQPARRRIELLVAALPEAKNVGLLFSEHSADMADLRKAITGKGLSIREQRSDSVESLHRDLLSVLQRSEVLLAVPDTQIYNPSTIRHILMESYRSGDPVIGYSPAYVRAGALCVVYSTPEQIALQAAYLVRQFIETARLPAAQHPSEFEVMVNQQVAHALGVDIKDGATLIGQIKAAEKAVGGDK